MLRFFVFTILFALVNCQQTTLKQSEQSDECAEGMAEAISDLETNMLGLYFFGLPDSRFNTKVRLITTQYNIKMKGGGDIVTDEGKCYNEVMVKAIKDRFGQNFFQMIEQRVDSLERVGLIDREALFPGSIAEIDRFLACNLNFFDVKESDTTKPIVYVELRIDTTGHIKNATVKKGFNERFDREALRVLKKMEGWLPAIEDQKNVESKVILQVKFDPSKKKGIICD